MAFSDKNYTVFTELKFALNALPETLINMLQSLVSVRRIEKYLDAQEVSPVPPMAQQSQTIAFQSCTLTWPQDRNGGSRGSSVASTPKQKFSLIDLTLKFPPGELSLICGKLGSGKTLLLYCECRYLTFTKRYVLTVISSFSSVGRS